jgi:3-hydroxyanthranilate 3,4-dioxygenase
MHRNQLTAMFVGGPNTRTDFHLDQSSEFFFQLRGNMHLPIIEHGGQRRVVHIRQGQVFLLPSHVCRIHRNDLKKGKFKNVFFFKFSQIFF